MDEYRAATKPDYINFGAAPAAEPVRLFVAYDFSNTISIPITEFRLTESMKDKIFLGVIE